MPSQLDRNFSASLVLLLIVLLAASAGGLYLRISSAPDTAALERQKHLPDPVILPDADPMSDLRLKARGFRADAATLHADRKQAAATASDGTSLAPPPTQADDDELYLRFRLRELEAYRRLTSDTGAAREAGEAFLNEYIRTAVEFVADAKSWQELASLGQKALTADSKDPIVRIYQGLVILRVGSPPAEVAAHLGNAVEELDHSQYPRIVMLYARMLLQQITQQTGSDQEKSTSTNQLLGAIIDWLTEEGISAEWRSAVCRRLLNLWDDPVGFSRDALVEALVDAFADGKKIDPYYTHLLIGFQASHQAWEARGSGWGESLSESQLAGFLEGLDLTRCHLEYAWLLDPGLPFPQGTMVSVAMALDDSEFTAQDWFDRAVEARIGFYPAYSAMLTSLQPRWGGSVRAMSEFAIRCIETGRFDTMAPYFSLEVLERIEGDEVAGFFGRTAEEPVSSAEILSRLLQTRTEYRERHPGARLYDDGGRFRASLVLQLEKAGMIREAAAEMQREGVAADEHKYFAGERLGHYGRDRLAAAAVSDVQRVLDFDLRLRAPCGTDSRDVDSLEQELQALRETMTADAAQRFLHHAEVIIRQKRQFVTGEWTDLTFEPGTAGWEICDGTASVANDGELTVTETERRYRTFIRPLMRFAPPLIVEAEFAFPEGAAKPMDIGITWQIPRRPEDDGKSFTGLRGGIVLESKVDEASGAVRTLSGSYVVNVAEFSGFQENIRFRPWRKTQFRLWDRSLEWRADDAWHMVQNAFSGEQGAILAGQVMYRSYRDFRQYSGGFRCRNLRVRRMLTPEPPEPDADAAERESYWLARIEEDEHDIVAQAQLILIRDTQRAWDEVIERSDRLIAVAPEVNAIHWARGNALMARGRYAEARSAFDLAVNQPGKYPAAIAMAAELLAAAPDPAARNGQLALKWAEKANGQSLGMFARVFAALAAAHAENGNYDEAVKQQQHALQLADPSQKTAWSERLALFQLGKPLRWAPEGHDPAFATEPQRTTTRRVITEDQ